MTEHRAGFIYPDTTYLLSHSIGLPLKSAQSALEREFFQAWQLGTEEIWPHWLEAIEGFRQALAALFNAEAQEFSPQVNLSSALTKIMGSLPETDRKTIVLSEQDFPSIGFVAQQFQRQGYSIRWIPVDAKHQDMESWRQQLDEQVALVIVSHVQSNTGVQLPVDKITAAASELGIVSVVDVAQSAGVIPIDLRAWQADFVIGSCVKWLCGGPGAGYLWAKQSTISRYEPVDVGWFSHTDPFEFDIHNFEFSDNANRFWGGTPSVLPYILASNSIRALCDIGIGEIRQHNLALLEQLYAGLPGENRISPTGEQECSGTAIIGGGNFSDTLDEQLKAAGIQCDRRSTGLRLSPHIYNTPADIEHVVSTLQGLVD